MKKLTHKLSATAAVAALVLGFSASPAKAFENVGWDWNLDMSGTYNTTLELELDLVPAGLIVMEKTQLQIGDVTAESIVKDVKNKPGSDNGGVVNVDENYIFNTMSDDDSDPSTLDPAGPVSGDQLEASLVGGTVDEGSDEVELEFNVAGQIFVPAEGGLDGVDLPSVESAATAVGNNQSITTTTALQLHDAQFLFGGFTDGKENQILPSADINTVNGDEEEPSGNFHNELMVAMLSGGLDGLIEPATVSANSKVKDIYNASVDSAATAIGNNMDINLNAITNADALMLADIHQVSYADITATSKVKDVDAFNYANLGALEGPLVSSTATAVGNNFSIDLTEPDPGL